nr:hypothetical protein [uncultured archaeon]
MALIRKTMKRVMLAFLVIFLAFSASALSMNFKESYKPSETIIGKLEGNVLKGITAEQIEVKRQGYIDVGVDYGVRKLGESYYVWLIAPTLEDNYTLFIYDVATTVGGYPEVIDFNVSFAVSGSKISYNVKPGVIFAGDDFNLEVFLFEDSDKMINVDFPSAREVNLKPGKNIVSFNVDSSGELRLVDVSVGDYVLPAYVKVDEEVVINDTDDIPDDEEPPVIIPGGIVSLKFVPSRIEKVIFIEEEPKNYRFGVFNDGEDLIGEVTFVYNRQIFELGEINGSIMPNSTAYVNFTLVNTSAPIREVVEVRYGEANDYLLIKIDFTENESESRTDYIDDSEGEENLYSCAELDGIVCTADEVCQGDETESADGFCCLGSCGEPSSGGSKAWIGWLILGIVVVLLVIVWVKYRKSGGRGGDVLAKKVKEVEGEMP